MDFQVNTVFHKTTSKGTKQESKAYTQAQVNRWVRHNHRRYSPSEIKLAQQQRKLRSFIDFNKADDNVFDQPTTTYRQWFNGQIPDGVLEAYNQRQQRKDRRITDYFQHVVSRPKNQMAIAEQLIIGMGSKENFQDLQPVMEQNRLWKPFWTEYRTKTIQALEKIIPEFKVYDCTLHLDETTPHLHIIGCAFDRVPERKNGLEFRVANARVFNPERMKNIHEQLREHHREMVLELNQLLLEHEIKLTPNGKEIVQTERERQFFRKYQPIEFIAQTENQERKLDQYRSKDAANFMKQVAEQNIPKADLKRMQLLLDGNERKRDREQELYQLGQKESQERIQQLEQENKLVRDGKTELEQNFNERVEEESWKKSYRQVQQAQLETEQVKWQYHQKVEDYDQLFTKTEQLLNEKQQLEKQVEELKRERKEMLRIYNPEQYLKEQEQEQEKELELELGWHPFRR